MSEIGPADPRDEPNVDDFVDVSLDADEWAAILQDHKDYEARKAREAEAELSLSEFSVTWDTITPDDVDEFRRALHDAKNEPDMQKFLASRPHLLVQPLGGGHGRWVIAEKKFGDQFRSDYMIAENSSQGGFEWLAVELEGPQQVMFNKDGHPQQIACPCHPTDQRLARLHREQPPVCKKSSAREWPRARRCPPPHCARPCDHRSPPRDACEYERGPTQARHHEQHRYPLVGLARRTRSNALR